MQTVTSSEQTKRTKLSPSEPDAELVRCVLNGDAAAFELIMRRHNQRLFRIARSVVGSNAEAEDVVQETYLRAYLKLDTFRGPNGFPTWLGKIALNEARGRMRNAAPVISLDSYRTTTETGPAQRLMDTMWTDQPDPERLAACSQLRELLENAIDVLPEEFRTVFILRIVEGLSIEETGQILALRAETVKSRLHRARERLKHSLGGTLNELMPALHQFDGDRCDRIVDNVMARISSLSSRRATFDKRQPPQDDRKR